MLSNSDGSLAPSRAIYAFALLLLGIVACSPAPADESVAIHTIQGTGDRSPLAGQRVRVRGVVTGDFQDNDDDTARRLGGFYLMSIESDDSDRTSEGLFVFEKGRTLSDVTPGDVVDVWGTVTEHFGETQLAAERIAKRGTADVEPVPLEFPVANFEAYEGMWVTIPETLIIAGNRQLERFGALDLAAGERPYQFTNREVPDRNAYRASQSDFEGNRLVLDDGLRTENPKRLVYAEDTTPPRAGNSVTGITGNLRWSRGSGGKGDEAWRLMPTATPAIEARNPRTLPPAKDGSLRVASFNLLNLFAGVGDEASCGPNGADHCRGADSEKELARQLAKTVTAFRLIDADVVGVAEIENNERASLDLLVEALAADAQTWAYVDAGVIGDDAIKVGLLFRPDSVEPVGDFALLTRAKDGRFDDGRNRPALAQTFRWKKSGGTITVVANHLKSKGSDCDAVNDPNRSDGQGNCNRTRTMAAAALADWSAEGPTGRAGDKVLVIGDLNAYLREDPIRALEQGGLVNLLDREIGPAAYSFVYDSRAGALDHALATPALAAEVVRVVEWHSNADEPSLYDYNLDFDRSSDWFDADSPWRSSDHDPVIVDIDLSP